MNPVQNFNFLKEVVLSESTRVKCSSEYKSQEIILAVHRLSQVIFEKPLTSEPKIYLNNRIVNPQEVITIKDMLDMHLEEYSWGTPPSYEQGMYLSGTPGGYHAKLSVRDSLNIASWNFFNLFFDTFGPLWGKSDSLLNVEAKLEITD